MRMWKSMAASVKYASDDEATCIRGKWYLFVDG